MKVCYLMRLLDILRSILRFLSSAQRRDTFSGDSRVRHPSSLLGLQSNESIESNESSSFFEKILIAYLNRLHGISADTNNNQSIVNSTAIH